MGPKCRKGFHYDLTYAPIAAQSSVRLILAFTTTLSWHTTQIDYVLAYSKAPVERELYLDVPHGYSIEGNISSKDYVLKLHGITYGQKQAGRVWYQHQTKKLIHWAGFTQSKIDQFIFYKCKVIYVLYRDDSILNGPDKKEIDKLVQDIQKAGLKIIIEGEVSELLGVQIDHLSDGGIMFS